MKKIVFVAIALQVLVTGAYAVKQPMMDKGIQHLQQAKKVFMRAANGKGGHKAIAIKLIDQAIDEAIKGKQYATTHHQ